MPRQASTMFYLCAAILIATIVLSGEVASVRFVQIDIYKGQACSAGVQQSIPYYPLDTCVQLDSTESARLSCNSTHVTTSTWSNSISCANSADIVRSSVLACQNGASSSSTAQAYQCLDLSGSNIVNVKACTAHDSALVGAGSSFFNNVCYGSTFSTTPAYGFKFSVSGSSASMSVYTKIDCSDSPQTVSASVAQCVNLTFPGDPSTRFQLSTFSNASSQTLTSAFVMVFMTAIAALVAVD